MHSDNNSGPFCDQLLGNIPFLIELNGRNSQPESDLLECGAKGKPSGLRISIDDKYIYAVRPSYCRAPDRSSAIYGCAASKCSNAVLRATFDFVENLVDSKSIEIMNEYDERSDRRIERQSKPRLDYLLGVLKAISDASPNFAFLFADMTWLCNRGFDDRYLDFAKALLPAIVSADPDVMAPFMRDKAVTELTMADSSSELTLTFLNQWLIARGGGIFKDGSRIYAIINAAKEKNIYDLFFGIWAVNACRMFRGESLIEVSVIGEDADKIRHCREMHTEHAYNKPMRRDAEAEWFFPKFYVSLMSDDQQMEYASKLARSLKGAGFALHSKMADIAPFPIMALCRPGRRKAAEIRHMIYDMLNSDPDFTYSDFICSLYDGDADTEAELFAEIASDDLADYDFMIRLSLAAGNGNYAISRLGAGKMMTALDAYTECPELNDDIKKILICGMIVGGSPYLSIESSIRRTATLLTNDAMLDDSICAVPELLKKLNGIKSKSMKRLFADLAALQSYMYMKESAIGSAPGFVISDDRSSFSADPKTASNVLAAIMSDIGKAFARSSESFKRRMVLAFRSIVLSAGYRCDSFRSYEVAAKAISASPISDDDAYALMTLHCVDPTSKCRPFMVTNSQLMQYDGTDRIRTPIFSDMTEAMLS